MTHHLGDSQARRFLIVGHEGCHNRGCEALVRTTVDLLREGYPASHVTVASMYPEHDVPLLDVDGIRIVPAICRAPSLYGPARPDPELRQVPSYTQWRLVLQLAKAALPHGVVSGMARRRMGNNLTPRPCPRPTNDAGFTEVRHLRQSILSSDLVISVGGDLFIEDWGPPTHALESIEYPQYLRHRTMVWGASIWPLKTPWVRDRVRDMLQLCDAVTVRDQPTLDYLSSLGVTTHVALVADTAFLMVPHVTSCTRPIWSHKPDIVVGFNGSPLHQSRSLTLALVEFFKSVLSDPGCGLVLVPHDAPPSPAEWDFLHEVALAIDKPSQVYLAPIGLDARETKHLIGCCDLFVGMRFHSTIASLSQFIPTLGLGYSPKFVGLHQAAYGHTEYLMDYQEASVDTLVARFSRLRAERDTIRNLLGTRIQELRALARRNLEVVRQVLVSARAD